MEVTTIGIDLAKNVFRIANLSAPSPEFPRDR